MLQSGAPVQPCSVSMFVKKKYLTAIAACSIVSTVTRMEKFVQQTFLYDFYGELLTEHQRRMDLMLAQCGMPVLNIHCPFDYLILLAVRHEEEDDFISSRMEKLLRKIFDTDCPAAYIATGE